ncbi:MAG: hypothetical protein ABI972_07345 [Acidobacteriota bacterium]
MNRRTQIALALLFAAPLLQAQTNPSTPVLSPELVARLRSEAPPSRDIHRPNRLWKTSLAVMAAASALDLVSSLGRRELNPLLRGGDGRFGARGFAFKSGLTGGALITQMLLMRNNPHAAPYATVANFGMAGVFTSAVLHNFGNNKSQSRSIALK